MGYFLNTTSMTLLPHTTSFDVVSAIETQAVRTSGWTTDTYWDYMYSDCIPYTVKPTAASTVVVHSTATLPLPTPVEIEANGIWFYDLLFGNSHRYLQQFWWL